MKSEERCGTLLSFETPKKEIPVKSPSENLHPKRATAAGSSISHGPYQPIPAAIYLYVPDVDATYRKAIEAGATTVQVPTDQSYGDRNAWVKDPFGTMWFIATPMKGVNSAAQ